MALPPGTKAPDFILKSQQPSGLADVRFSDNFGKRNTVLLFFPLAFTTICTEEMCTVTAALNEFTKLDAAVIGISVDSPFAQEAWAQKERIAITLASDLNKTTAKAYGVLLEDLMGLGAVAARAAFVVDKTGIIQYSQQTPTPHHLPDFEAIKATLARLK